MGKHLPCIMEMLTLVLLCLSIGLFLARYPIKHEGADFLTACVGMCTIVACLQDPSIPPENLILVILPAIVVVMLTLVSLAFGNEKNRF